jgi:hypothetical protein
MAAKKKISMKQAMAKYEGSAADNKMDKAGAKKLMVKSSKKMGKRGY